MIRGKNFLEVHKTEQHLNQNDPVRYLPKKHNLRGNDYIFEQNNSYTEIFISFLSHATLKGKNLLPLSFKSSPHFRWDLNSRRADSGRQKLSPFEKWLQISRSFHSLIMEANPIHEHLKRQKQLCVF